MGEGRRADSGTKEMLAKKGSTSGRTFLIEMSELHTGLQKAFYSFVPEIISVIQM